MLKIFFTEINRQYPLHPILYSKLGVDSKQLGVKYKADQFNYNFDEVSSAESADIIMVPHALRTLTNDVRLYLKTEHNKYLKLNKPFVISVFGDMSYKDHIDFGILLKVSAYRVDLHNNEIIIPAYSEDWSEGDKFKTLDKKAQPVVSFCGMADFPQNIDYIKYIIKVALNIFSANKRPGVYFRKKLIKVFNKSNVFAKNIIVRKHFLGVSNVENSLDDYKKARIDFYESIINSHFVITPKGGGNYSNRFYETLSLGRIPIIPDTDIVLPLDRILNYKSHIIRFDPKLINSVPKITKDLFDSIGDISKYQIENHRFYKENLRFDIALIKILELIYQNDRRIFALI